jgi:hypothetical protein
VKIVVENAPIVKKEAKRIDFRFFMFISFNDDKGSLYLSTIQKY